MDTPPDTPPPTGHSSIDSLHIHYCDFAYEHKGPFRMAVTEIGDTTSKTFAELLSGPTMDIYVGKSRRHWSLHRNLLCHHSTWFQKQVEHGSMKKGGKDVSVELFDDDPRAFELLIKWLYQGKIDNVSDMPMDKKWDYADACQQLYILCDKINLPQLKNLAIDQFRKGCNEASLVPGPEEMKPVYDKTPPSSPFRKLVSKIAARQIMDPESESDASKYRQCFEGSPDFAIDVVNAIKAGAGGQLFQDPTEEDGCCYHEHSLGQRCEIKPHKIWKLDSQKRQQRESVEASTLPRDEPQFGAAWRRFCQLYVRDGKTDISKTRIEWGTRRPRVRRRGFRLTKVAYIVSAGLELEDEGETEEQEDEIRKRILEKGQQRTW